jgi:hypothetical protein
MGPVFNYHEVTWGGRHRQWELPLELSAEPLFYATFGTLRRPKGLRRRRRHSCLELFQLVTHGKIIECDCDIKIEYASF